MRELKAQFCARRGELFLILGVEAGFFILGEILFAVIMHTEGSENTVFQIGTLAAVIAAAFVIGTMRISVLPLHFNLAVSMRTARKRFMPAFLLVSCLENLTAAGAAYLLSLLETRIMQTVYSGMSREFVSEYIFQWKYILAACLGLVALNMFMGMLFMKYGQIAWAGFWVLWVISTVGAPKIYKLMKQVQGTVLGDIFRSVSDFTGGFTENGILAAAVIVSLSLLAVSWIVLRRQEVKM